MTAAPFFLMWILLKPPERSDRTNQQEQIELAQQQHDGRPTALELAGATYALATALTGGLILVRRLVRGGHKCVQQTSATTEGSLAEDGHAGMRTLKPPEDMKPLWIALTSLLLGVALISWTLLFAKQVFPRIPEQFGGTRTKLVQLLIDEAA